MLMLAVIKRNDMALLKEYKKLREYSLEQVSYLKPEDFVVQPVDFVSPAKWNLAHTSWFFEEFILKPHIPGYVVFNKAFSFLFNSYYVNVGERLTRGHRGVMTRPELAEVMEYRAYVDRAMEALLTEGLENKKMLELTVLGINHEQQHQELFLSDIKYIFGHQPLLPVYNKKASFEMGEAGEGKWIMLVEGIYEIGFNGPGFSFDNEHVRHKVYIHDFEIRDKLVSNGEYLEFINEGGYQNPNFWHSDAWTWLTNENVKSPLYWQKSKTGWSYYTLSGHKEIDPNAPVTHISYYEAFAFAQWAGYRLPTEFEWEAASDFFKWGERWEWTESAYLPYPGYKKAAGAVGEYNGKFMVNQKVLRGASLATTKGHSRKTYRNFFHPHLSWQFTGIRLAR